MKYPAYKASSPLQVNDGDTLNDWLTSRVPKGDFLDINVWVALAHTEHDHHKQALAYWQAEQAKGTLMWFCRTTMLGMIRLLSQKAVMGPSVLSLTDAQAAYLNFLKTPLIKWLPETTDTAKRADTTLRSLIQDVPARMSTDAYLAAIAQSMGLRMVTFDADFKRFDLENWLLLTA
jgi:toxin-antitoxin system PIN domain toxin